MINSFNIIFCTIGVKHTKYIDGEPVDDEEDDNEDYIFTSPIDNMDVSSYFLQIMSLASVRESQLINQLQLSLSSIDQNNLKNIVSKVEQRRALALTTTIVI